MNLPPLPDMFVAVVDTSSAGHQSWESLTYHTADQMREYGALCRRMALEEAAKFCESQQVNHSPRGGTRMFRPFNSECMGTHEGIYYAKAIMELLK